MVTHIFPFPALKSVSATVQRAIFFRRWKLSFLARKEDFISSWS